MEVVVSEAHMGEVAAMLLERVRDRSAEKQAVVVGLVGELGAGKTTFVKALAALLGVQETVTSPTFVLEKIYDLEQQAFDRLVHIDAYRLEGGGELGALGWHDLLTHAGNLIVVEWADRVLDALPEKVLVLRFEIYSEQKRKIIVPDS